MLILRATTDVIRAVTDAAATVDFKADAMEVDNSVPPVVQDIPAPTVGQITTATTTTLIACSTSNRRRNVKYISAYNSHASLATNFRVEYYDGTTARILINVNLQPGESLQYSEGGLWLHLDSDGCLKPAAVKLDAKLVVTSDVTNATTSFADITGLTVALKNAKKYAFQANLFHVNNASTTGSQFGVNIGAAPTVLMVATIDTVTPSVTAAAVSAGAVTARDTAATAQTTGSTTNRLAILSGYVVPSADGTFAVRCASEVAVAAGLVVKAGSWLRIWEVDN